MNNLLSLHSEIEGKHFKLWLTSEPVLLRVLNAGIFHDSQAHLERIRLRLRRYVQNPSFKRARSVLERSHYCIIAGIPGIGKTTLAEVLLADLVDRKGFETFRISRGLDEIGPIKNTKRKQAFYFDDFLGTTSVDKLQKNEDRRLIDLIEEVRANENWRFILTTREYILNAARLRYEAFAHPEVDLNLCVVKLDDYTRPIRARILYNHIYFSDLPKAHKLALIRNKGYEGIILHRNYNPRVIEYITEVRHACTVQASLYLHEFTDSLNHPTRIWDHAFRHQISEAARHLLLVLSTMPDEILIDDLEDAFWAFYRFRQTRFGFPTKSGDWNDALKELDGNFILTTKVGTDIAITFHNPSIRDFLEGFLSNSESDVLDLVVGAHFYDQYVTLWEGKGGHRYRGIDHNCEEFLRHLRAHIFNQSCRTIRSVNSSGEIIGLSRRTISNESRAGFVALVSKEVRSQSGKELIRFVANELEKLWNQGKADKEDLARLLPQLVENGFVHGCPVFLAAKHCLTTNIEDIGDFRGAAEFITVYPDEVLPDMVEELKSKFLEFAVEYSEGWDDDPDLLRQVAGDLEFVAEKIEVDVSNLTEKLETRAGEIEEGRLEPEPDDDRDDDEGWGKVADYSDDVNDMFQDLQDELEA
ncbi:MAG TPA: hypothetical protein VG272_02980 [Candidatus Acidoferrales bacterium]|nr:hypothetical protein [Candidatus Acidoferrales bacterium]